ncbi:MAG: DUF3450 family protein [Puniceicoccaceae bacterium]|nr:MAG: DUF3450 family protein [Puniceicoccaceae bacterium]
MGGSQRRVISRGWNFPAPPLSLIRAPSRNQVWNDPRFRMYLARGSRPRLAPGPFAFLSLMNRRFASRHFRFSVLSLSKGPSGLSLSKAFSVLSLSKGRLLAGAAALLFGAAGVQPLAAEDTPLDRTLSSLDQWVETERIISRERSDWETQQQATRDLISIYRRELALLTEQIEEAREATTAADERRSELVEAREDLLARANRLRTTLSRYEANLREVVRYLPDPVRQEIAPLLSRLRSEEAGTPLSISQRMQGVVGILSQVDRFNSIVTMVPEVRDFGGDGLIQVRTLYFGLAVAFYADDAAAHGGFGIPGPDGWVWTQRDDLAPQILELVRMYARETTMVEFIPLPVEIRNLF